MKGYEIVREETARLARGMAPLVLIAFGILLLAGFEPLRTGVSLLAGTAYSILLFAMIGRSAARAVLFPPAQGTRIVRRGYFFRYLLTGAAVFAVNSRAAIESEAVRLSTLGTTAVILLLLLIYRSFTAVFLGLLPVASGALAGIAAVALLIGGMLVWRPQPER